MKTDNGYELSDFSVDIYERGEFIFVRVECFADNRVDVPFNVSNTGVIDKAVAADPKFYNSQLALTISQGINHLVTTDITAPEKCECQDHYWFKTHPDDRQEYWRTKSGRIYPKTHTIKCPKNPANRRKKDD